MGSVLSDVVDGTAAAPKPSTPQAAATPPPVNSFGASAASTSLGPRPADAAPAAAPAPPAAFDPDAT